MSTAVETPPATRRGLVTIGRTGGRCAGVERLVRRMVSPLCGLDEAVSFSLRGREDPRFVVCGGQLTGVHRLLGLERAGSYHVGGTGVVRDEAVIRTLGESVERYSQLVAPVSGDHELRWASAAELAGEVVQPAVPHRPFAPAQYESPGFPFVPLTPDDRIAWVRARTVFEDRPAWMPTQLAFVGYQVREDEPWVGLAVTTGCAAHTDRWRAIYNALSELVAVDAAMGHWYSGRSAPRILLDARTRALARVIERFLDESAYTATFVLLPAPGFELFVVACLLEADGELVPAAVLGLGGETMLERAMYKALLEAVATVQLGKLLAIAPELVDAVVPEGGVDPSRIYDFGGNVGYYARGRPARAVAARFSEGVPIAAGDLAPDRDEPARAEVAHLLRAFREQRLSLLALDCTSVDARQLGFMAYRLWAPELIPLCQPSAPPLGQPRFRAFGGASHADPHPYP